MANLKSFLLICLTASAIQLSAQSEFWSEIPSDSITNVRGIFEVNSLGITIPAGNFLKANGERYFAGFNSSNWEYLADSASFYDLSSFVDFEGGLLIGSRGPAVINGNAIPYCAYYNGSEWSTPFHFNQGIRKFRWIEDTLYVIGHFSEINGQPAHGVARYVNGQWESVLNQLPSGQGNSYQFFDIVKFQGQLYLSGNILQANGPRFFVKIVNGELEYAFPSDDIGWAPIEFMEVYQGELYLAGSASSYTGLPGGGVFKWDGQTFSQVGGPMFYEYPDFDFAIDAGISDMKVHGGYLYAVGGFNIIDGLPISKIARWDGNQWCGLYGEMFQTEHISKFGFVDDEIMLYSREMVNGEAMWPKFWLYTGGDAVSNCTEPLSTLDDQLEPQLSLHPNPAHTYTTLSSAQQPIERLGVYDLQGRLVHAAVPGAASYRIPLAGFPAGMYVVSVQMGGEVLRRKLVVE